ncbi:MAG: hypothetical protein WA956_05550 [Stenotrophomonas sp.]
MDWRGFVQAGIDADALTATGDGMALALVEWARTRRAFGDDTAAAAAAWLEQKEDRSGR